LPTGSFVTPGVLIEILGVAQSASSVGAACRYEHQAAGVCGRWRVLGLSIALCMISPQTVKCVLGPSWVRPISCKV
jgi:hypothetical protein